MIGTEFLYGQGLGNQLFCYVTARCLALDKGYEFGTVGQNCFGDLRYSDQGHSFYEHLDLGKCCSRDDFRSIYHEKVRRIHTKSSIHDRTHGCDIRTYDSALAGVPHGTLIMGIMQSEEYFIHRKAQIFSWLKVRPELDSYEFTDDNLCIINMRGGEYAAHKELYLPREYWLNGMENMRAINSEMRFMVVTEDTKAAGRLLPEVPAYHFSLAKDYVTIKNARYLLLSNSSFAFFPAFTSETVKVVMAPKYWARHNVSDGYWSTAQNIYSGWIYQDRSGKLSNDRDCRIELAEYCESTGIYENESAPISGGLMMDILGRIRRGTTKFILNNNCLC